MTDSGRPLQVRRRVLVPRLARLGSPLMRSGPVAHGGTVSSVKRRVRLRWAGLGLLLLQLGWVLALPPFAGMDEWDHAYRASAVAHGEWVAPPSVATRGTGAFVTVPTDIVRAAESECERLDYAGADECVGTTEGSFTQVASGAGRYPPLYYALVGWPSLFLDGAAALYGMRLAGLLLCWVLLMASFASLRRWARPLAGYVVCLGLTPTVLYASAVVAPNGLEMVSGLALWTALGAIAHDDRSVGGDRMAVMLAVASGSLLLSLRSLGPLWAALILALALLAWPALWTRIVDLARTRLGAGALLWLVAVGIAGVGWIQTQGSLEVGQPQLSPMTLADRVEFALRDTVVWTFQFMAAFPYRNQPAHAVVYACLIAVITTLLVLALRRATRRERWSLVLTVSACYVIPFAITVATIQHYGTAWQGRYTLPLLLGALVVGGLVLSRRVLSPPWWALWGAAILVAIAHTVSATGVLRIEHAAYRATSTPSWALDIHPAVLAVVVLGGSVAFTVPFIRSASQGAE